MAQNRDEINEWKTVSRKKRNKQAKDKQGEGSGEEKGRYWEKGNKFKELRGEEEEAVERKNQKGNKRITERETTIQGDGKGDKAERGRGARRGGKERAHEELNIKRSNKRTRSKSAAPTSKTVTSIEEDNQSRKSEKARNDETRDSKKRGDNIKEDKVEDKKNRTTESNKSAKKQLNKLQANFSKEELELFRDAIEAGRINQTHFTDPSLDYCYRCPICQKIQLGGFARKGETVFWHVP